MIMAPFGRLALQYLAMLVLVYSLQAVCNAQATRTMVEDQQGQLNAALEGQMVDGRTDQLQSLSGSERYSDSAMSYLNRTNSSGPRDGSQESRWKAVPDYVRHLYDSIADDRGFVINANSRLVQNSTAIWTFPNKLKGRDQEFTHRLSFTMHALFQPKKPAEAQPEVESAFLRLYRKPLTASGTGGQRGARRRRGAGTPAGGGDRVRVTVSYHATRRSPASPVKRVTMLQDKHGWETVDLTEFLRSLQNRTRRRRRLSLSVEIESIGMRRSNVNSPSASGESSYHARDMFDLSSKDPSTMPLLTVFLKNKTGQIEELMPFFSAMTQRRLKRSSLDRRQSRRPTRRRYRGYCQMQEMEIDFADDLKWKEILTPRLIRPNDCVGSCAIPVGEVKNNGVLRHWYWETSTKEEVSPLSCIPTRFASVTMLSYVDGVYEVLPFKDMVAVECGCA